jgi:hypothetical protein
VSASVRALPVTGGHPAVITHEPNALCRAAYSESTAGGSEIKGKCDGF